MSLGKFYFLLLPLTFFTPSCTLFISGDEELSLLDSDSEDNSDSGDADDGGSDESATPILGLEAWSSLGSADGRDQSKFRAQDLSGDGYIFTLTADNTDPVGAGVGAYEADRVSCLTEDGEACSGFSFPDINITSSNFSIGMKYQQNGTQRAIYVAEREYVFNVAFSIIGATCNIRKYVANSNLSFSLDTSFGVLGVASVETPVSATTSEPNFYCNSIDVSDDYIILGGEEDDDRDGYAENALVALLNLDGTLATSFSGDGIARINGKYYEDGLGVCSGCSAGEDGEKIIQIKILDSDSAYAMYLRTGYDGTDAYSRFRIIKINLNGGAGSEVDTSFGGANGVLIAANHTSGDAQDESLSGFHLGPNSPNNAYVEYAEFLVKNDGSVFVYGREITNLMDYDGGFIILFDANGDLVESFADRGVFQDSDVAHGYLAAAYSEALEQVFLIQRNAQTEGLVSHLKAKLVCVDQNSGDFCSAFTSSSFHFGSVSGESTLTSANSMRLENMMILSNGKLAVSSHISAMMQNKNFFGIRVFE